jgi:hypothetical protein
MVKRCKLSLENNELKKYSVKATPQHTRTSTKMYFSKNSDISALMREQLKLHLLQLRISSISRTNLLMGYQNVW